MKILIINIYNYLNSGAVGEFHISEMSVPNLVESGNSVTLGCKFVLPEDFTLYSLTWWKESHQFFEFTPKGHNNIIVYPTSGIQVDVSRKLTLENLSHVKFITSLLIFFSL